jgi:hypothetical protein
MALLMLCQPSMRSVVALGVLAACTTAGTEVSTPDDGAYQRFVVDDFTFPATDSEVEASGSDLGGPDINNAIGGAIAVLSSQEDIRDDASIRALIGSGQVPSSLEVFGSGNVVGLQYFATPEQAGGVLRGAALDGGGFSTDGLQPGAMTLLVPALVDADPTPLQLEYTQMKLAPSGSGAYDVRLQGLVDPARAASAVCTGLLQTIANDPSAHDALIEILEDNPDGSDDPPPTMTQCLQSSAIKTLLAPDVTGPDKQPFVSIGIGLHVLTPRNVPPFE